MAEHKSGLALTKDTPYLALAGELWDVYCDEFSEYWSRYNGIALYYDKYILCVWWELKFMLAEKVRRWSRTLKFKRI